MNLTKIAGVLFIPLVLACGTEQEQQEGVTLSGKIDFPQEGLVILERYTGSGVEPFDTIQLDSDNSFNQFVAVETPGYYRFNIYGIQQVNLILNKDDIQITGEGNNAGGKIDVQGSTELDQLKAFNQYLQDQFVKKENALNQEYVQARQAGDNAMALEVQEEYMKLQDEKSEAIIDQIRSMGTSLATIQAINYIDKDKYYTFFDEWTDEMAIIYPDEPNLNVLVGEADKMRRLAIGQPAPEISLPNPDGVITSLSSLKGSYVLVDFWAEWCKPCRAENPNIVRAYEKYHAKGFEIYGVSLDQQKAKWQKAINDDKLFWTQVSDLQGWRSSAAGLYNVSAIPASFLLDEEGIIIAKNVRGPALQQKLEELLGE
jgi:peroxiredoxin